MCRNTIRPSFTVCRTWFRTTRLPLRSRRWVFHSVPVSRLERHPAAEVSLAAEWASGGAGADGGAIGGGGPAGDPHFTITTPTSTITTGTAEITTTIIHGVHTVVTVRMAHIIMVPMAGSRTVVTMAI